MNETQQKREILENMGFECDINLYDCYHKIMKKRFDFSAVSVAGIVNKIYNKGFYNGVRKVFDNLQNTLNIQTYDLD